MTSSITIEEQVNRAVFKCVGQVSTANGYTHDIQLERQRRRNKTGHLRVIQCDMDPESPLTDSTTGYTTVDRTIAFEVYVMPSDDDETPLATYTSAIRSDITTAMLEDRTFGNLVMLTTPLPCQLLADDSDMTAGIAVLFELRYRYRIDDPTRQ